MQILKIIALLTEYPDETLWENREEALSLIEQDLPALLPFARQHLDAALLDKQAEWCEVFERVVRPRCCCLSTFMPNPAIAARRWST